jgi:hypothetical protein
MPNIKTLKVRVRNRAAFARLWLAKSFDSSCCAMIVVKDCRHLHNGMSSGASVFPVYDQVPKFAETGELRTARGI